MVLEATTFCVEKRGAWLPTWDRASAEAAEAAAAIPSHQGLADRACPNSHPHATDALMFWSSTLGALTRTARISGPPSIVPSRGPEAVLTGFPSSQGEAHIANHHISVRLPPVAPPPRLPSMFTPSAARKSNQHRHQQQHGHKPPCFFCWASHGTCHPPLGSVAASQAGGPRVHSVIRGAHVFTTPSSARVVHPSIIDPAGQRRGHISGTLAGVPDRVGPPASSHGPSSGILC